MINNVQPDTREPNTANSDAGDEPVVQPSDIRLAAMNLLARREHTLRELQQKLHRRYGEHPSLEDVLQRLADENLQSDTRFAESFVRHRSGRGYGPMRIRQEMRDKGISDAEIGDAFEAQELDWRQLAKEAYERKFGPEKPPDLKEKARRVRFMQYRGFDAEHYRYLLND